MTQVLCKTLGIELSSLTPGTLLKELNNKTFLPSFGATPATLGPKMGGMGGPLGALGGGGMGQLNKAGPMPDFGPVPTQAPPSLVPQQGHRGLGAGPMDPMAMAAFGGMPSAGPGASGAGLGAVLAGTPQQQGQQGFSQPPSTTATAPIAAGSNWQDTYQQQQQQQAAQAAAAAQQQQQIAQRPPEPKFRFLDISTAHLNGIVPHITVDSRLTLIKDHPDMIQLVTIAVEKSIQASSLIYLSTENQKHVCKSDLKNFFFKKSGG